MWNAQLGPRELRQDKDGVRKIRRGGDGRGQEKIASSQRAGPRGGAGAAQFLEAGQPHQRPQRQPVAGSAVGRNHARAQRAKGRRAKADQRLHNPQCGLGILEHQTAVGQRQHRVEAAVGRGHFNLLVAGKVFRHLRLEKEDQSPIDGQVVGTVQMHGQKRVGGLVLRALAEQRNLRTG